jgi:hypothetical protein
MPWAVQSQDEGVGLMLLSPQGPGRATSAGPVAVRFVLHFQPGRRLRFPDKVNGQTPGLALCNEIGRSLCEGDWILAFNLLLVLFQSRLTDHHQQRSPNAHLCANI